MLSAFLVESCILNIIEWIDQGKYLNKSLLKEAADIGINMFQSILV